MLTRSSSKLNYTPMWKKSATHPWGVAPVLVFDEPPRSNLLASLENKLSDTASLGYLRLWSQGDPGAREANLSCSKKQKKTATNVTVFFCKRAVKRCVIVGMNSKKYTN